MEALLIKQSILPLYCHLLFLHNISIYNIYLLLITFDQYYHLILTSINQELGVISLVCQLNVKHDYFSIFKSSSSQQNISVDSETQQRNSTHAKRDFTQSLRYTELLRSLRIKSSAHLT